MVFVIRNKFDLCVILFTTFETYINWDVIYKNVKIHWAACSAFRFMSGIKCDFSIQNNLLGRWNINFHFATNVIQFVWFNDSCRFPLFLIVNLCDKTVNLRHIIFMLSYSPKKSLPCWQLLLKWLIRHKIRNLSTQKQCYLFFHLECVTFTVTLFCVFVCGFIRTFSND